MYQHVVIDEGQDFGKNAIEELNLIELLRANVMDNKDKNGTFYLFYDKNQMVQSEQIPSYISEADCKLTLYRNCRNTENIAVTCMRFLGNDKRPKLFDGAIVGDSPEMYIVNDSSNVVNVLNQIIETNWLLGYKNLTILTCKTEETSDIIAECSDGFYLYKGERISFTTCRRFKGLEADVIILIDVDKNILEGSGEQVLYVGSSRARYRLCVIADLSDIDCNYILEKMDVRKNKNPCKSLATAFNAKYKKY